MSHPAAILYYSGLIPGSQLANRLQDLGYRVQVLVDVAGLVEICQKEKPLLAVVEIVPGGSALAAITQLRKDPATQHIPVLGYSTVQDPAHLHQAQISGVSLLAGTAAIADHLPELLERVLQVD